MKHFPGLVTIGYLLIFDIYADFFSLKFWKIKYICYFCCINLDVTFRDQIG